MISTIPSPFMIKQFLAVYRDANGKEQTLQVLAYDLRRAVMSAAELIPTSAKLIRVINNPDWDE